MTEQRAARPDFFIVGAPKCGTTALYDYLRQHPDIYMADAKELHYFGSDLERRRTPRLSLEEYLSFFRGWRGERRVGEASVRYLHSRRAAEEIAEFDERAAAIIMLRNPVDMMHAMHAELVYSGMEDIRDFADALEAEPRRRAGEAIPATTNIPDVLFYRDAARFAEQVERFHAALGRENVHVIVYDDFARDTAGEVRRVFEFLGVDPEFTPEIKVVNPSKRPRFRALQSLLSNPPGWLRPLARTVLSRPARKRIYKRLMVLNARPSARAPLDPELRRALTEEFAPEVARLGAVIGRDLSHWSSVQ